MIAGRVYPEVLVIVWIWILVDVFFVISALLLLFVLLVDGHTVAGVEGALVLTDAALDRVGCALGQIAFGGELMITLMILHHMMSIFVVYIDDTSAVAILIDDIEIKLIADHAREGAIRVLRGAGAAHHRRFSTAVLDLAVMLATHTSGLVDLREYAA